MKYLIFYLLNPFCSRRCWWATHETGLKPFKHSRRYLVLAKTGKQNACEQCKSLFYTHSVYTFIKDEVSSTVGCCFFFFLSNKPGWGGFARDALAKRLVLQRSKFQLLNVTFDGLHAAPSSRLWQKHEPQFRAKKPRKADLIFRQTIPEGVRSNFGVPKNAEVWLFGWGNYWPATSAAKIRRRRRGVKKKNQTGGKKKRQYNTKLHLVFNFITYKWENIGSYTKVLFFAYKYYVEFSLDIIKRNDFYQTVLKRPMQITQIEAIKAQIAFQGNQMASEGYESFAWAGEGARRTGLCTFRLFRPKIWKLGPTWRGAKSRKALESSGEGI